VPDRPSWLAALDEDDLPEFAAEMRAALHASVSTRDPGPLETCLHAWRATGEALADPATREVLARDWDLGDFGEVPRP
jgi:Family of unknown function (DUF6247)